MTLHRASLRGSLLLTAAAAAVACVAGPAWAQTKVYNVAAQEAGAGITAFARQAGVQILAAESATRGRQTSAVVGAFTLDAGLERLLAGAGLRVASNNGRTVTLQPIPPAEAAAAPAERTAVVDELVVTGSLLRGGQGGPSPVTTVTREDIDSTGRATVAEMLTDLPQAFGSSASADTYLANTDGTGANSVLSTGVNLRGLGPQATLALVNGRRMAGSGLNGDFADVSSVPTAAVERVEVLLDGASALYGSDAVGGVVNIILRKDFDGAETRARIGVAQGGVGAEYQVAQTIGRTWASGYAIASYERWRRDQVAADARDYTASADLRPFGGTDRRLIYSHPANVLVLVNGAYVPTWAVPAGQNGVGLKPASFQAGVVNLENQRSQSDILPEQDRSALYVAGGQHLGSRLEISGDLRLSRRKFASALPGTVNIISVTSANPFFVSPNGTTSSVLGYGFTDELGPLRSTGDATTVAGSFGADLDLGRTWRANLYAAYAQDVTRRDAFNRLNTRFLNEALGNIPDDPATAYVAARDGYFNPYGDGGANSRAVLDFVGSGYLLTRYASTVKSLNGQVDGDLFALPGGPVKLAIGGQAREERFDTRTIAMTSRATPTTTLTGPFERQILAGFAELRAPLVGPANAMPGIHRLELSLAGRIERYNDVGTTKNPKIGVIWSPAQAFNLRASYGTSFRAPSLPQVFAQQDGGATFLAQGAASKLVFIRFGGNTALQPERAKSWTTGVDYVSASVPGLKLSLTWFDTRFKGQIGTPVYENITNVLGNPAYAPFVQTLDPNNAGDQAKLTALVAGTTSAGVYPVNAYTAIVDGRYVNTGGLHVRGLDFTGAYGLPLAGGKLALTGNVSYLIDYKRKVTPGAAWLSLLDQAGQPVDLRAKAGGTWSRDGWSLTGGVNYVDDYRTVAGQKISSWTTVDAQVAWRVPGGGLAKGLSLALSAQNLFANDPPFYDNPQGVGYDTANADPLGRFISLQLTKRW